MANVRAGNTWFVDSTGTLVQSSGDQATVKYLVISGSHATNIGSVTLSDNAPSKSTKFTLYVTAGNTISLDFSSDPVAFFGGIDVTAISNVKATIVLKG
jgi:hypothetical protein